MKPSTIKNLAQYLCQRLYCSPTGNELICLLGNDNSTHNIDALIRWIKQRYNLQQSVDLDWWDSQLRKHLLSKGVTID